jgi:hypothetical protein
LETGGVRSRIFDRTTKVLVVLILRGGMMHEHGIGNFSGALIFFSFIGIGVLIALYLMFIKKDDKPAAEKH